MALLLFSDPYLDLMPRRDSVAISLRPAWSTQLPGVRNMMLRRYNDYVLVQERAPGKSLHYLSATGDLARSLEFTVMNLSPSAVGPLCLTTTFGAAYFWEPGASPKLVGIGRCGGFRSHCDRRLQLISTAF
jgi:hypothetical protein